MKEHGILFKTPMVQAILDGSKTATRRLCTSCVAHWEKVSGGEERRKHLLMSQCKVRFGDLLYVKETYAAVHGVIHYKADYKDFGNALLNSIPNFKWSPSLYMPKNKARIWLQVTDVEVQRLQEISEYEALKEGVSFYEAGLVTRFKNYTDDSAVLYTAKESFKTLWDSINGVGAWDKNPYVYKYSFQRINP